MGIVAMETATAVPDRRGPVAAGAAPTKRRSARPRNTAIAGLTLGFLTWQVAFMSVGGKWFGMGMSKQWNGVPDAFRFFITLPLVLVYLTMNNDRIDETRVAPNGWTSGRLPASSHPAINRGWTRIAGFTTPSVRFAHGRKPPRPAPAAGRSRRVRSCSTSRCSNGSCATCSHTACRSPRSAPTTSRRSWRNSTVPAHPVRRRACAMRS
ncbi:DUF2165 family protein [Burkholderia seminalis]|uniref:DUF2165 family protein n=1 Tax=Burkholderia seminalis TaxID=488731 RepID=UPI0024463151|nr:DUF2165 family protein [Burkholderia seminalis]